MSVSKLLEIELELQKVVSDLTFKFDFSQEYRNFKPEDGDKNWQVYDEYTSKVTGLEIKFVPNWSFEANPQSDKDDWVTGDLFQAFIQWVFSDLRTLRFFPPHFFRQAEFLHGSITIHAERLKILTLMYYLFQNFRPLEEFDPFQILTNEMYFFKKSNTTQRPDLMLFYLAQQIFMEKQIAHNLFRRVQKQEYPEQVSPEKILSHYDYQLEYIVRTLKKTWELSHDLAKTWDINQTPYLYYMEKFVDFNKLLKAIYKISRKGVDELYASWISFCLDQELGAFDQRQQLDRKALSLSKEERKDYITCTTQTSENFMQRVHQVVDQHGVENDRFLKNASQELFKTLDYKDMFNTGIYEYYMAEQNKIQWHSQDVRQYIQENKPEMTVTDNDYEMCDIIKEIAYCEGYSYSIGYNNMVHVGHMHPFAMWNVQQCHEELKHFHAIRIMLQEIGASTQDLDEQFLAESFNEPHTDNFKNQYDVFMINFLGETHNIRAYLLLADCFDNKHYAKIMRWITEDEVVHKKVFAAHFAYLCQKDPTWEKNSYECLMDSGLGIHQAKGSPHYHKLMQKIGKYYSKKGVTDALKFLNMSMRAQYLELKALFSPEVFKVSEYDFRQKHLKAYAF